MLRADGGLFRQVGKHLCQISTEVYDFKVAQHPDDPAAVYVVKGGGLFALMPSPTDREATSCPSATLDPLVPALERGNGKWQYKVVNRKHTSLSLIAKDTSGRVTAWDAKGVAVYVDGVTDLKMNECFGTKKSFSSYVAFALDTDGRVSKIGGKDPRNSKADADRYDSLAAFFAKQRVCQ